jgi:hypothetical protein
VLDADGLALLDFALNRLALGRLAAASTGFCGIGEQQCCQREDETECSHGKTPCSLHGCVSASWPVQGSGKHFQIPLATQNSGARYLD